MEILWIIAIFCILADLGEKNSKKKKRVKKKRRKPGLLRTLFFHEKSDWEKTCDDGGRFFGW